MSQIGIMGGTFNPPHLGHIEMAKKALERLSLDKVLFMTGGNPPHKSEDIVDAKIRHEMVKKTIDGIEGLEVSEYEINKEGYSYTADTLAYLKEENPQDDFFFILGADSLDYIDRWYHPQQIFKLSQVVVFARRGFDYTKKTDELSKRFKAEIIFLEDDIPDISSTEIRKYVDMGLSVSEFVVPEVEHIIKERKLYRGEFSKMREEIKKALKPERFLHTMGVCRTAVKMAELNGVDTEKAYIAALLHDSAKNIEKAEMYRMCAEYGVELDDFEKAAPPLVHAKLGGYLVKAKYGIDDEDIINAVRWHTLGREGMSALEKIIFVADMIEDGRDFFGIEILRKKGFSNLDEAVYSCADATIGFNEKKGNPVHPNAYLVRDYYKKGMDKS